LSVEFVQKNTHRHRFIFVLAAIPRKSLRHSAKPRRLLRPLAASSSSSPPPEDAETTDPVKLAFARAAAYKKERANPTPKPPPPPPPPTPPPPQPSAKEYGGGKGAFERALEYRNGNGEGPDGGSAPINASPAFGELVEARSFSLILYASFFWTGRALQMLFVTKIEELL
jgi:hypothetical protein